MASLKLYTKTKMKNVLFVALLLCCMQSSAQSGAEHPAKRPHDWWQADWKKDSLPGISLDEAYNYLKGRKSKTVIVAIVGESLDIDHNDLKNSIWVNKKEIPGNGIDDDHNGFVDDVHGWCFTADKNNIYPTNQLSNEARTYMEEKKKFEGIDTFKLDDVEKIEYDNYVHAKSTLFKRLKMKPLVSLLFADTSSLTIDSARFIQYLDHLMPQYKDTLISKIPFAALPFKDTYDSACNQIFAFTTQSNNDWWDFSLREFDSSNKYQQGYINDFVTYGIGIKYDKTIIDDTSANYKAFIMDDTAFGTPAINIASTTNSMFMLHSTMIAGIIAAKPKNENGVRGISNNTLIMQIGVAPPDKSGKNMDLVKGIYYAVNNGAQIINMSLSSRTGFEDHVKELRTAFDYADKHHVLIVQAAGNNGSNMDNDKYFMAQGMNGKEHDTYIRVGATTTLLNDSLVSVFSNFGGKTVDLFAPGTAIYSTAPGNKYESLNGTSFSTPIVVGIAALLKSYFPILTAKQIKEIIMKSVYKPDLMVVPPPNSGIKNKMPFSQMSKSGGIVNAYNAVRMADEMTRKSK